MKREWTENQKKAINARGSQILVSAAAGSGKTAVLSERVKNLITVDRCPVNELLVVTFTKAAAAEMRDRIYKAVEKYAAENDDDYLYGQLCLLPTADICTIDSFCAKLVRENFHSADVAADFSVLEEIDNERLIHETADEVIEKYYSENKEEFTSLSDMYMSEKNDKPLAEVLIKLYKFSRSFPSTHGWLDTLCESYSPETEMDNSRFAKIIFEFMGVAADYHEKRLKKCFVLLSGESGFDPNFVNGIAQSVENIDSLGRCIAEKDWDGMCALLKTPLVVKAGKNTKLDDRQKKLLESIARVRDCAYDFFMSLCASCLPSVDEHKADCIKLYPAVKLMCDAVKCLDMLLAEKKKALNSYSFDDIMHKCIDLLVTYDGKNYIKTALAEELSEKYSHILIDEYQDTNEAQNMIFEKISRNKENLFFVGDMKQSIYSFRLANPELFSELRDSLPDYDENTVRAAQITLEKNFRSRRGVTECVNYVFSHIMSKTVGDIEYNEREYLYCGAGYKEKETPDVDILCIEADGKKSNQIICDEAQYIAEYIKKTVKSNAQVKNEKSTVANNLPETRSVRYGDFAILLRSTKNKSKIYADALSACGIPVESVSDGDVSEAKEVMLFASLIRAVNNPRNDVALCAVMLSPLFGFTADEIAGLKIGNTKTDIFTLLNRDAESSEKTAAFLRKLRLYRNVAATYPVNEFVDFIADDTAIEDIYAATEKGVERRGNINGIKKLAADFSKNGRNGLNSFVRYMDNAFDNKKVEGCTVSASSADCVKIMTIHKSKGLEYPYVILADSCKKINKMDARASFTVSRETGVGVMVRSDENFQRYDSLGSYAAEKSMLFGTASEELRVLYVAMTRAREKLVFVCSVNKSVKENVNIYASFDFENGKIHPYAVYKAENLGEIVLSVFARHENCEAIREMADLKTLECEKTGFAVNASYIGGEDGAELEIPERKFEAEPDLAMLARIAEKCAYSYEYDDLSTVLAKRTASSTEAKSTDRKYFAASKPSFAGDSFTGAERGTAIHKFLELCDFRKAAESIGNEAKRLLDEHKMTDKELAVLDTDAVKAFLTLPVGVRLLKADELLKEYEFNVLRNAGDLYPELNEKLHNEQIVVQGKLDCAFIENGKAVLIDYKTDNMTDESEFVRIYRSQLEIYADALMQCRGVQVAEIYIYSFKLKKFIAVTGVSV